MRTCSGPGIAIRGRARRYFSIETRSVATSAVRTDQLYVAENATVAPRPVQVGGFVPLS